MPSIRGGELPEYANRAGDPAFPPPYIVDNAGMDIFLCYGDPVALKNVVDRALNAPADFYYRHHPGRGLRFELASTVVGFACIDVGSMRSKPAPGQSVKPLDKLPGITSVYAHQTEVAVMVQIQDQTGMPYWYLPYVLNGLPTAVTTGREVYGYPKQHAEFAADGEAPGNGKAPGNGVEYRPLFGPRRRWEHTASVHAYDLKLPSGTASEAEFALTKVLEFRQGEAAGRTTYATEAPRAAHPAVRPDDIDIFPGGRVEGASSPVTGKAPPNRVSAVAATVASEDPDTAFLSRIRSDVPYVFLRQFRDPEREAFATYQSTVIGRLVPDSADALQAQSAENFSLGLPWTFNLAFARELFGIEPDIGAVVTRPVVGLLSGEDATFDVLRAMILWPRR
ncbi:hypothetical protein ACQPZX_34540 [Actinoplanes sp. CA-142083]|uniref:hypothetical protein n=1 Tax=Actinoplanes sp. CA-142083 TaxID=3239903 RepID=UPI003D9260F3